MKAPNIATMRSITWSKFAYYAGDGLDDKKVYNKSFKTIIKNINKQIKQRANHGHFSVCISNPYRLSMENEIVNFYRKNGYEAYRDGGVIVISWGEKK